MIDQTGIIRSSSFTRMDCGSGIGLPSPRRAFQENVLRQLNPFIQWTEKRRQKLPSHRKTGSIL